VKKKAKPKKTHSWIQTCCHGICGFGHCSCGVGQSPGHPRASIWLIADWRRHAKAAEKRGEKVIR
jgi:hypothetical protein